MSNDKSAEEIVRGLQAASEIIHERGDKKIADWLEGWMRPAADLIESQAVEIKSQWARIAQIRGNMYAQADIIEGLRAQLSASQQRERAAVDEIEAFTKERMQQLTLEQALVLQPVLNRIYTIRKRGPQEAEREPSKQPIFGGCPVCGCVVSNLIKTCPRCGKPIKIGPQEAGEERK